MTVEVSGLGQLADVEQRLARLAAQFNGPAQARILTSVVRTWPDEVDSAVKADLGGDLKHSGWGVNLLTEVKVRDLVASVEPTRRTRGPWRVATSGRNQGRTSGRVRGRKQSRWNGRTAGKGTWSDAESRIRRTSVPALEKAAVKEIRGMLNG